MAFNLRSPVRSWLKDDPDLTGKQVSLFITSTGSETAKFFDQLSSRLKKCKVESIDAVTTATHALSEEEEKKAAVRDLTDRIK